MAPYRSSVAGVRILTPRAGLTGSIVPARGCLMKVHVLDRSATSLYLSLTPRVPDASDPSVVWDREIPLDGRLELYTCPLPKSCLQLCRSYVLAARLSLDEIGAQVAFQFGGDISALTDYRTPRTRVRREAPYG